MIIVCGTLVVASNRELRRQTNPIEPEDMLLGLGLLLAIHWTLCVVVAPTSSSPASHP